MTQLPSIAAHSRVRRCGSVLLLTLIVVALLTLGALSFFERMFIERQAVAAHVRQTQTRYLAESGVEYLRALLIQDPTTVDQSGGTWNNPTLFQGKLVADAELAAFRARFTALAPNLTTDGYYGGIRYGLEDESSKLNLNTVLLADNYEQDGARNLLLALPGMTEAVADAILDWIDADDQPRLLGAERDHYSSLDPPYAPRNGPLGSIEELLLVRDVTPALLFGADLNRNALVEASEEPFTAIEGVDNSTGVLNRGWAAYLTLDSAEANLRSDGSPKIDVNMDDLESLHTQAAEILDEEMANFIIAYRQGGRYEGEPSGRRQSANSLTLDFNQPGRVTLANLLDLIGVWTMVVEEGVAGQATAVESPFANDRSAMRDYLPKLFDNFAVNAAKSIPGRINVNQAPRPLVMAIPGIEPNVAEQIIYNRDVAFAAERPERAYETWLLTEGLVDLEQMKRLMPLVTAGGDVFRVQVVGYFEEEGPAYRMEVVIDATRSTPVVKRRRDLLEQGPGYSPDVLGIALDNAP